MKTGWKPKLEYIGPIMLTYNDELTNTLQKILLEDKTAKA